MAPPLSEGTLTTASASSGTAIAIAVVIIVVGVAMLLLCTSSFKQVKFPSLWKRKSKQTVPAPKAKLAPPGMTAPPLGVEWNFPMIAPEKPQDGQSADKPQAATNL
ncbi:unnamed protein product [Soboliphyme baturini]|uniref:DAG1 domain-containing protein n=1 Tax=Soboliphyme baturini TaxID=241478 RepID=A0A183JAP9_9BILA|nr:unnamed protein product [Soboliphyme baturini]